MSAFVGHDSSFAFVESGMGELVERRDGEPRQKVRLTAEQGYAEFSNEPGVVLPRTPARLLAQMPQSFFVSLPLRARRFVNAAVEPVEPTGIAYEDVAMWINAERDLRLVFRDRWSAKARDPAFRSALVAELRSHPEWSRVLFPPKKRVAQKLVPPLPVAVASHPAPATPVAPPITEAVELPPSPPIATVEVR
jgi:hypothetical protein